MTTPDQDDVANDAQRWVDRYGDSLFRYAMVKTGDRMTAEDLVQETFIAAVTGRQTFRNEATVSTWLFAILKNKIADHFRRRSRTPTTAGSDPAVDDADQQSAIGRRWRDDPAAICENSEFQAVFQECLQKLPNKLSEAFIMREINLHSPKEICDILGVSSTNLSMRLQRCRLAIRDCLNQHWFREKE